MWFKSKTKNRRLGRGQVLDVKLRSSRARAARARTAGVALGVAFGTIFGLYLLWRTGEWALNCLVYENKAFAIDHIDLETDGVIATDQLRRWMGVKPGQNLMALDLGRVKRNLELIPMVQSASVERILPHTLRVCVIEREPIAQLNLPRMRAGGGVELTIFQLDGEGYVIPPLDGAHRSTSPNQPGEQLPVLTGVDLKQIRPGERIDPSLVQAALQLIMAFEHSPRSGLVELKRIDVSAQEVLTVTTGEGSEVTFGLQDFDQQLRRWHEIAELAQKLNKAVATLDLAVTNNIPARWIEASAVPPANPTLPKLFRNKKKHV